VGCRLWRTRLQKASESASCERGYRAPATPTTSRWGGWRAAVFTAS
jgi:hypothetical protein